MSEEAKDENPGGQGQNPQPNPGGQGQDATTPKKKGIMIMTSEDLMAETPPEKTDEEVKAMTVERSNIEAKLRKYSGYERQVANVASRASTMLSATIAFMSQLSDYKMGNRNNMVDGIGDLEEACDKIIPNLESQAQASLHHEEISKMEVSIGHSVNNLQKLIDKWARDYHGAPTPIILPPYWKLLTQRKIKAAADSLQGNGPSPKRLKMG